mgnify:CR=1 FL=1
MSHFNEEQLEQSIIELFKQEGYEYTHGGEIVRDLSDVLLRDDLKAYLQNHYSKHGITSVEIDTSIKRLEQEVGGLYENNVAVMRLVMDGFSIKRQDATKPPLFINLVDFDNPKDNIFRIVNQLEVLGDALRRPDAIVYVNGIPVVVLEFKSAIKEDTTIENAYTQLTVRYRLDIPQLFKYNAFVVISDGVNNKFGSLFAPYDFFYAWRKVEQTDRSSDGINSLFTMVQGLFRKERLVDVLHNFIYLPDDSNNEMKIVCRYPQYFATTSLLTNILKHSHLNPNGDGKGGTYFGATGCGKSFTMLFLTRQLMKCKQLSSPTIVLITDRTDLDDQLSKQFLKAKKFIGDETIMQIDSREHLGEMLRGRTSGGVFLTTIQKFSEDISLLSDRANIICISDEAHRSQTGMGQHIRVTVDGVQKKYGFAKYLRDSLPRATYVGFTGTPIDASIEVFGPIVDRYTMIEAVDDEITRRIVYEGRAAKVILDSEKAKEIEEYYSKCAEEGANENQIEESKRAMTRMDVILNDPKLLANIADDFVQHYENRVEEGSTVVGKTMIVVSNRQIAYSLYKAILALRPEWTEVKACCDGEELTEREQEKIFPMPKMMMVMTTNKDDEKPLRDILNSEPYKKKLDDQFKEVKSNFKIAIVVDMWITGFDVPCLDTMYCFKPLQQHTLVQTISRVNRVYPGKDKGLVVDYLGIKNNMNVALKRYGGGDLDATSVETMEQSIKMTKDELDILRRLFHKFDNSLYFNGAPLEQLNCLNLAAEFVQETKEREDMFMAHTKRMRSAYNICCNSDEITQEEDNDIHFFIAVRSIVYKMTKGDAPDAAQMNRKVASMIKDALISQEVEEITKIGVKPEKEIDLLSSEYMERLMRLKLKNTKVKLMEKLLRQVIDNLKKVNKTKGIDFTKRLNAIIEKYNDRSDNTTLANEIIDAVVDEMAELLSDVVAEKTASDALGISFEEKAFFDILKSVAVKYDFYDNLSTVESKFNDARLIALAKEIKVIVDDKSQYTDWSQRTDIKAELKVAIIVALAKAKYPPFTNDEVFKEILEQAENFKKNADNRQVDYATQVVDDGMLMAAEDVFIYGSIPIDLPNIKRDELTAGSLDLILMYAIGSSARQKTEAAGRIALGIKEDMLRNEQLAAYKSIKYLIFHYWSNPTAYQLEKEPTLVDKNAIPSDYLLRMEKDAVKFLLLDYNPQQPADLGNINVLKTQRRGEIRYLPFVTTLESITDE